MFDFDGTLADSGQWFLEIMNDLADEFGFDRMRDEDRELLRNLEAMEVMRRLRTPLWKMPMIMKRVREWGRRDAHKIPVFPGVNAMLRALREGGVITAAVSSNSEENIRTILGPENCALITHFRSGASLLGKKHKIRRALKDAGVAPHEAIYIGDEIRDARAAREAGVPFGAVSWGYTTIGALRDQKPDEVFASMEEIAAKCCQSRPNL